MYLGSPVLDSVAKAWLRSSVVGMGAGHGGAGITLHWGVAQENLALVQQALGLRSPL